MTANNSTTTPDTDVEVVVEPTRLQKFVLNRPRTARVVAIVGATVAVLGVGATANTVRKNKHHLSLAANHASDGMNELGAAVSPAPENTNA